VILSLLTVALAFAGAGEDPAYPTLTQAFDALRVHDYDQAVARFEKAAELSPTRADIHKNLAYTLLKTGDSETAREHFGAAMRLDPADQHVALEYAFLCFEAHDEPSAHKAEARRIFARISQSGDATAKQAFQNIDGPLESGIARWEQVLATSTPTFSAHYELAQLAEQRDDLELATANYKAAFKLLPERKSVLLDLARVDSNQAMAALLAASRGGEPRAAEMAREKLPDRYPYVYEFRQALELDPKNDVLHRELAYLLLRMSEKEQAKIEFKKIDDPLSRAQLSLLESESAAKTLAERSYKAGFLQDARRYFLQAFEQNPMDRSVALKLGWTSNMLHDDVGALHWFDIARHSPDAATASEAQKAYENLLPETELFRTTVWLYPLYSSRWSDMFGYGQIKTEMRQTKVPYVRPYFSVRFVGDARPPKLSENSFILGVGVATQSWHRATAWFEAGEMVGYLGGQHSVDFRGGLSYARTLNRGRWFLETNDDSIFISHFQNDLLTYSQNRIGIKAGLPIFWNSNITFDAQHQYWANFAETGPGFRFRLARMPRAMSVTVSAVRGFYLTNHYNPGRPNFNDFRTGVWYAFTK
jgi:tetratricopeptide (TPR) repeat protein